MDEKLRFVARHRRYCYPLTVTDSRDHLGLGTAPNRYW